MIVSGILLAIFGSVFGATKKEKQPEDGFKNFYQVFTRILKSGNSQDIANFMSEDFQWASDPNLINKMQAIEMMDQGDNWKLFLKAIKNKPQYLSASADSSCRQSCYAVWIKNQPVGFIFRKINGDWKWSEFRAD